MEVVDVAAGHGCARCGGSPLCASCGHARKDHSGTFGGKRRRCRARDHDLQSLTAATCECAGFVQQKEALAEAPFVDAEPLPPLRVVSLDS